MRLPAGKRIGPYEVKSLLGAGGMGEVYLAFDPRLSRQVAIKILPAAGAENPRWVARFEREARAAGALNHPNIVVVHDVGSDGGVPYLVAELLDGETLRERIAAGPVPLKTALDWAQQIARGLAAAHACGIIHRDLKPANLFVTREGLVKILDFGVAKLVDAGGLDRAHESTLAADATQVDDLTASGAVVGTLGYMSPEQVRGQPADARSDIFAFGAVVYELVTRRRAFRADTGPEIAVAILKDEPPPMTTATGPAPVELERLVRRCLEKRPADRFQTARDLCSALESPVPPTTPASPHRRRMPLMRWVLAVALLAALVGTTYYLAGTGRKPIDSIAVLPFVNASADPETEYLSEGITESVINNLSKLPQLRVMALSTVFHYKGREADPQTVGRDLGVGAVLLGRVLQLRDNLIIRTELVSVADGSQLWGEQYDRKLSDLLTVQQEIAREVSEKLRLRLTGAEKKLLTKRGTENIDAYQLYLKGQYHWYRGRPELYQYESMLEDFQKSREYFQRAIDLDPSYALAYSGLAYYYGISAARGLFPPNETWPKAAAAATKALELDPTLGAVYNHRAALYLYYYRDWPAAESAFRRAIELSPNDAEVHHHYGLCLILMGRVDEAITETRRAQELEPLSPRYGWGNGIILYYARRPDEAIEQFRKALELNPSDAFTHELLGNAYEQRAMYTEAVAEWRKAMTQMEDEELIAILDRANNESGYRGVVRSIWQKRLERLRRKADQENYVAAAHFARAYARLGDKEQALAWLAKAYEERNKLVLEARIDPVYDDLRSDPRFVDLLRRAPLAP